MSGRILKPAAAALMLAAALLAACETSNRASGPVIPGLGPNGALVPNAGGITSSCGTTIALDHSTSVKCKFAEQGYTGTFSIAQTSLTANKVASVSPRFGTSKTVFTVTAGKDPGYGFFTVKDTKKNSLAINFWRLNAAQSTFCIHPSDAKQSAAIPTTGGISGSIDFGKFPAGTTGCEYVKLATGDDVEKSATENLPLSVSNDRSNPGPILTISAGEAFDGQTTLGVTVIVSGAALKTSPDLNFPDGNYEAVITTADGHRSALWGTIFFTAKNGVLTVGTPTGPNGKPFPLVIPAHESAIIAIYPRSVSPTIPTPKPSASPTSMPSRTSPPGTWGNPPPPYYSIVGTYSWKWGPGCPGVPSPCTSGATPVPLRFTLDAGVPNEDGAVISLPGGFWGKVHFDASGLDYMELRSSEDLCPSYIHVPLGDEPRGIITIPRDHPHTMQCEITYTTRPKGKTGNYWAVSVIF
jgi:hypothetical protein